ncbi:MAG: type II/IV secretion system protein [Deltaproteobacteria bacterium]|nr:type II/IV secretion system protein [Deltaproteobacteria bacterium]
MAKKIGELLLEYKLVADDQLAEAVAEQKKSGERLGSVLIRKGYVTVEDFEYLLSRQQSVPAISLQKYAIAPETVNLVPEKFMKKNFVLPIEVHEKTLTVAMANPHDYRVIDELRFMTGLRIAPVVTSMFGIKRKLRDLFPATTKWEEALDLKAQRDLEIISPQGAVVEENLEEVIESASEAPIVKIINSVILAALDKKATHVHIVPGEESVEVKLRVNGLLESLVTPPKEYSQNLVNRLKILGGMDILKRRIPLQGYFRVRSEDQFYDIDVATFPVLNGEQAVLTFQQPFSKEELRLENLGMAPEMSERFQRIIQAQRGLILVLGPPDSGKTSTIYATLNQLKRSSKATVSYENPIKNRLSDINQAEPNERAGIGYAQGLKALIRQDVDYLMVGDVSDPEVLGIAVEAALGKTLVLARMVFNHTIGSIPRILEQGIPPFMLYSALAAVVGQRLVRRLCPSCLESFEPPEPVKDELRRATGKENPRLYRAVGCRTCGMTGYRGRLGIFELLVPDDQLRNLIVAGASQEELEKESHSTGFRTLLEDGFVKAVEGMTTYEEVRGIK